MLPTGKVEHPGIIHKEAKCATSFSILTPLNFVPMAKLPIAVEGTTLITHGIVYALPLGWKTVAASYSNS